MLEPCDVLFVKGRKNASRYEKVIAYLIKNITKSEYYHVVYFVRNGVGFEANSFRESGFVDIDDNLEFDVKRLKFSLEDREKILKRILTYEGAKYDWIELFSLFLRKKFHINIFYDNKRKYICSEELFKAVDEVKGIEIVDQSTGDVCPQDDFESPYLADV